MKVFFDDLFAYNELMNNKMFETIINSASKVPDRIMDLAAHILLVHQSWSKRMQGSEGLTTFWDQLPIENWQTINKNLNSESVKLINTQSLDDHFTYKNTLGKVFTNTYADGLFHIVNHSNYHRGQINQLLRAASIEPVITDYIFYKR